jgi:alpha-1,2-mannosyltransferase
MAAVRDLLTGNRVIMWLVAALGGAAIHLVLWQFSEPPNIFNDFYKANLAAAETLWEYGLSATWPLTEPGGFSNLPVLAWICVPLFPLGEEPAAWTFLALGLAATAGAWALLVRLAKLDEPLAAGLLFLFLVNGPIVNSLREGQSSHFILLLLVVGLLQWRAKRTYLAGLVFGLCASFKLPLMLLGAYFFLRARWRIVAGGATTIGVVVLSSAALFGASSLVAWYKEWVEPFLGGSVVAFNVQSINGFLIRLTIDVRDLRDWELRDPPAVLRIARLSASAVMFGISYWLIWRRGKIAASPQGDGGATPRDLLEFLLVLTLALITSPLSWTHYYVFLLIPWALYMGGQLPLPDDAVTRRLMHSGLIMVSMPVIVWSPMEPSWYASILARTTVSVWLFGALLMFVGLGRGLWQPVRAMKATVLAPSVRA